MVIQKRRKINVTSELRKFRTKYNPIFYMELNLKFDVDKLKSVKRMCLESFSFGNGKLNLILQETKENVKKNPF